ncbi:hypothetical protein HanRHA438_Chr10g0459261 [Helianthus annuus]|nr:hypothetical protein HanRHA438_Chr10g0459261 [Helianthus annuus]
MACGGDMMAIGMLFVVVSSSKGYVPHHHRGTGGKNPCFIIILNRIASQHIEPNKSKKSS